MDIVTYALAKKLAAGAVSGVASMSVNGLILTINCTNGQVLTMTFPEPADGVSIQNAAVNADAHLMVTLSDGTVIDAGEIPTAEGFSPSATVTETPTGAMISITDKNGTTEAELFHGGSADVQSISNAEIDALF